MQRDEDNRKVDKFITKNFMKVTKDQTKHNKKLLE
jgi:hypothetical protein